MDPVQPTADQVPEELAVDALPEEATPVAKGVRPDGEMAELPVEDWDYQQPRRGQIRPGVILSIGEQEMIIGLDAKRDGVVPFADLQRIGAEALSQLAVGDRVDVFVLQPEDQEGNLVVSLFQAWQAREWQAATERAERGEIWEAQVIGYNKGGLVVPVGQLRGFVPASQIPSFPQSMSQDERLHRLSAMMGERLRVKIIEINRRNRRLILSALAAEREWRQAQRERLISELREGEVRRGVVTSLCPFGAFVDLGGAEGLVHLTELTWQRVRHPKEAVKVGDEVEVYVLKLDAENKRIGLSLKRLQPEPWARVEDKYELGQLVEGVVSNVVDFGAFAQIEEGIEGLIHVSELTDEPISHPRDIVRRGDRLLLRIIRIDLRRKRLGLSLKRVLESEWADWARKLQAAEAEGAVPIRARRGARLGGLAKPRPRPKEEIKVAEPEEPTREEHEEAPEQALEATLEQPLVAEAAMDRSAAPVAAEGAPESPAEAAQAAPPDEPEASEATPGPISSAEAEGQPEPGEDAPEAPPLDGLAAVEETPEPVPGVAE